MSLRDLLEHAEPDDARRPRQSHSNQVVYQAGEPAEVYVNLKSIPDANEQAYREKIREVVGLDIPEDREVLVKSVRFWGDPTQPYVYVRFDITDRVGAHEAPDAVALLKDLRGKRRKPATLYHGDSTLVTSWNDWQVGKRVGNKGTLALAERLDRAYDGVSARARELRSIGRGLGHLVVIGGGDMIEGCTIFPHQSYEIDSDRRTQVRNATAFILEGLDRLAPLFERVTVLVVPGNHGENRIDGKRVNRTDNDDCAVFEHAALAASRDKRLGHVEFLISQGDPARTMDVNGWVLGTTHGHVYGRGSGGSIEQKAFKWFMGQAAGRRPIGDSDILVTHHFHHLAARDWGACQWIQTPAMDGGSEWVTDLNGQSSQPGMLTFVTTPDERVKDIQIV